MKKTQQNYKKFYDWKSNSRPYQVGDWVLVRFPAEESGKKGSYCGPGMALAWPSLSNLY